MKQIKAVVRPELVDTVRDSLEKLDCCHGIMISDVVGHGNQHGITQVWRGEKFHVDMVSKVALDVVVSDNEEDRVIEAILGSASLGEFGDGKIFVYNVEEVIRIRTGERGEKAL